MLLILLASAALHLRPLTASAYGRHACVRLLSTAPGATSIACPKFLVTTVAPEAPPNAGKFVFNSKDKESSDLPVFLVDVKYEDKGEWKDTIPAEWKVINDKGIPDKGKGKKWTEDKGEGDFSGTVVTQEEFTARLAKEAEEKELLFFIHGFNNQDFDMVTGTDNMQTNCDAEKPKKVLVVPVDWACTNGPAGLAAEALDYYLDQRSSEIAGGALWELIKSLKKEGPNSQLNVIAHSMGNRVLRCMGQEAVKGDKSWNEEGLQDKSLLQAAPEDLQGNENFFQNIFFVSADIPESVFDEPDGSPDREQAERALQSGVAALAVMTKRMHVLHANGYDNLLAASFVLNFPNARLAAARLGERGPRTGIQFGLDGVWPSVGSPAKVWDKIGDALEKYDGIETDVNKNYNNVYVQDCSGWNRKIDPNGHGYQYDPESVAYYLRHMTLDQSMTKGM